VQSREIRMSWGSAFGEIFKFFSSQNSAPPFSPSKSFV
jgi:hypothetical protein